MTSSDVLKHLLGALDHLKGWWSWLWG